MFGFRAHCDANGNLDLTRHDILARIIRLKHFLQLADMFHHHHYQPINVPTAGAQAFLMDLDWT
jgi:hypothetical protein